MQRRHFEVIANALNKSISRFSNSPSGPWYMKEEGRAICEDTADALASTNPNFNRSRFLAACGVED
jgi:hypothetical protein